MPSSALCCSLEAVPSLVLGKLQPAPGSPQLRSNWPHLPQSTATGSGSFPSSQTWGEMGGHDEGGGFLSSVCGKRWASLSEAQDALRILHSHFVLFVAIKEVVLCRCEGGHFCLVVKRTCKQNRPKVTTNVTNMRRGLKVKKWLRSLV